VYAGGERSAGIQTGTMAMIRNLSDRVVSDNDIRFGKPTIRGTRITVEDVLRLAAIGLSNAEIRGEYPGLEEQDVLAAHKFAADHLRDSFARPQAAE
jgi:uncharacterized protein (DUF433 family)